MFFHKIKCVKFPQVSFYGKIDKKDSPVLSGALIKPDIFNQALAVNMGSPDLKYKMADTHIWLYEDLISLTDDEVWTLIKRQYVFFYRNILNNSPHTLFIDKEFLVGLSTEQRIRYKNLYEFILEDSVSPVNSWFSSLSSKEQSKFYLDEGCTELNKNKIRLEFIKECIISYVIESHEILFRTFDSASEEFKNIIYNELKFINDQKKLEKKKESPDFVCFFSKDKINDSKKRFFSKGKSDSEKWR